MTSSVRCCVPGCNITGHVLHGFPNPSSDRSRFNAWLNTIGGDLIKMDTVKIWKSVRVCRRHFEEKYHCRYSRISKIAVPTLYMPDWKSPLYCAGSKAKQFIEDMESQNLKEDDDEKDEDYNEMETHVPFEFHEVQEMVPESVLNEDSTEHNPVENNYELFKEVDSLKLYYNNREKNLGISHIKYIPNLIKDCVRAEIIFGKELSETINSSNDTEKEIRLLVKNKNFNRKAVSGVSKAKNHSLGNGRVLNSSLGNSKVFNHCLVTQTVPNFLSRSKGRPMAMYSGPRKSPWSKGQDSQECTSDENS